MSKNPERYTCGNGEGMFQDDTGSWVHIEDLQAYADEVVNKMTDKEIDKIIQNGKWGYPQDKAGDFMVKELKAFAKEILEHLKKLEKL